MSQGTNGKTFTVEFGDECNRTIILSTRREQMRGRFSIAGLHRRNQGGRNVGDKMSRMPDIPGMRMTFRMNKREVHTYDPLESDTDCLDKINAVGKSQGISWRQYKAVPPRTEVLDADTFKTMVREIAFLVENGSATVVSGDIPGMEVVNSLPGRYLNDPGNTTSHGKPRYEKPEAEAVTA